MHLTADDFYPYGDADLGVREDTPFIGYGKASGIPTYEAVYLALG
jgi:hypothetical protein